MSNPKKISLSKTNCFLFSVTGGGYLLLDCGYDREEARFYRQLSLAGIALPEVRYLFLTHHHDDHAGLCSHLVEKNPEIQVIMHERCAGLIQKGMNDRAHGGGWCSAGVKRLAEGYHRFHPEWTLTFPPYPGRDSDYLIREEGDDLLHRLGIAADILMTPGHTTDSVSVVMANGDFYCGDAACNMLGFAGAAYAPPYISDLDEMYRSWQKILAAGIQKVIPSHGKPFPAKQLRRNLYRIRKLHPFEWDE